MNQSQNLSKRKTKTKRKKFQRQQAALKKMCKAINI
jgi:hypothetical protein